MFASQSCFFEFLQSTNSTIALKTGKERVYEASEIFVSECMRENRGETRNIFEFFSTHNLNRDSFTIYFILLLLVQLLS